TAIQRSASILEAFGRQDYENNSWNHTFDFKTSSYVVTGPDAVHGVTAIGLVAGLHRAAARKRQTLWHLLPVSATWAAGRAERGQMEDMAACRCPPGTPVRAASESDLGTRDWSFEATLFPA